MGAPAFNNRAKHVLASKTPDQSSLAGGNQQINNTVSNNAVAERFFSSKTVNNWRRSDRSSFVESKQAAKVVHYWNLLVITMKDTDNSKDVNGSNVCEGIVCIKSLLRSQEGSRLSDPTYLSQIVLSLLEFCTRKEQYLPLKRNMCKSLLRKRQRYASSKCVTSLQYNSKEHIVVDDYQTWAYDETFLLITFTVYVPKELQDMLTNMVLTCFERVPETFGVKCQMSGCVYRISFLCRMKRCFRDSDALNLIDDQVLPRHDQHNITIVISRHILKHGAQSDGNKTELCKRVCGVYEIGISFLPIPEDRSVDKEWSWTWSSANIQYIVSASVLYPLPGRNKLTCFQSRGLSICRLIGLDAESPSFARLCTTLSNQFYDQDHGSQDEDIVASTQPRLYMVSWLQNRMNEENIAKVFQLQQVLGIYWVDLNDFNRQTSCPGTGKWFTLNSRDSISKKKIIVDSTFTEEDLERICFIRDNTWIPINQLPLPPIEIVVGYVNEFPPLMVIIDQIAQGTPPSPHVSMRYELLRFCTFRSYPKEDKPYLIKLAEAGFYYASDRDGAVCYCCGIRKYNWTASDVPMKVHQRINPSCAFLTRNEEVNVKNGYNGPFSQSIAVLDSIPEPQELHKYLENPNSDLTSETAHAQVPSSRGQSPASETNQPSSPANRANPSASNTAVPKHSQYATKQARIVSFTGWPETASHTPEELAEAGFFYAGFGDCVRCFYCGIGLRHWTKDDDPWIEHSRWSKNCVYVKQKKGEEFMNLVQLAVQYQNNSEPQSSASGNQVSQQEIENILLSDAAQSVLEMGYLPRVIKDAVEQILLLNRQAKITAELLMEKVFEMEAPATQTTTGLSEEATAPSTRESESLTEKTKEGSLTSRQKNSKDKTSKAKKDLSQNAATPPDPKTIKAENEQLREQTICKICLDKNVSIVFLPCGHLVTCEDCAPAMKTCPICRAVVKGTVRTYMS